MTGLWTMPSSGCELAQGGLNTDVLQSSFGQSLPWSISPMVKYGVDRDPSRREQHIDSFAPGSMSFRNGADTWASIPCPHWGLAVHEGDGIEHEQKHSPSWKHHHTTLSSHQGIPGTASKSTSWVGIGFGKKRPGRPPWRPPQRCTPRRGGLG